MGSLHLVIYTVNLSVNILAETRCSSSTPWKPVPKVQQALEGSTCRPLQSHKLMHAAALILSAGHAQDTYMIPATADASRPREGVASFYGRSFPRAAVVLDGEARVIRDRRFAPESTVAPLIGAPSPSSHLRYYYYVAVIQLASSYTAVHFPAYPPVRQKSGML